MTTLPPTFLPFVRSFVDHTRAFVFFYFGFVFFVQLLSLFDSLYLCLCFLGLSSFFFISVTRATTNFGEDLKTKAPPIFFLPLSFWESAFSGAEIPPDSSTPGSMNN